MTKNRKNNKKTSLMRIFVSDNHKGLPIGNTTALQNMFTVNYPYSIRKAIFEHHRLNVAQIQHMLRKGELVIPIMDYNQAEKLRAELATDVFQNEPHVRYRIEKDIDATHAKQARLDISKTYLNKPDADFIDGVLENGFWPLEIFGSTLGENVTIGIMDRAIHLWQEPFPGVNITKHNCDHKNCNIEETLSLNDFCMHGTYVAGTILKFLPGLKTIHDFHSDISIRACDPNHGNGLISLHYIESTFLTIEKQLQQLERTGKQYTYILNISSYLQSSIDKNLHSIDNTDSSANRKKEISIYHIISRLHKNYPRFQMIVSAGNDATMINDFYRLAPEVMAIGAHDLDFKRLSYSNAEEDVITSTIGESVDTVIESNKSGTSFSSPIMAVMSGIIMSIIPDLKNHELRQIIQQLSVPDTEFLANDSPFERNKLHNPIFIFDLVRFCKILNKDYSHRIDSKLLKLLNEKSQQFYLESVSKNVQFSYSIPNNDGNVQFNIDDEIGFTVTIDNQGKYYGSIEFCLSSTRIPPMGYWRLKHDFEKYVWHDALLSSAGYITLPPHKQAKLQVELTRQPNKITGRYKKDNSDWSDLVMTTQGDGKIQNIMLGLKSNHHVQIVDWEPLHFIRKREKKALLFSAQKKPAMFPTNYADKPIEVKQQLLEMDADAYSDPRINYQIATKETAVLSMLTGLVLFSLYCLRQKFRVNNGATNSARTRSTISNS